MPTETVTRSCSVKKVFLKTFAKFTEKHPCRSPFLTNLQVWRLQFYQERLLHRCFPVNFAKFLRTSFLQNTSGRLLLWLNKVKSSSGEHHKVLIKQNCLRILRVEENCVEAYGTFNIVTDKAWRVKPKRLSLSSIKTTLTRLSEKKCYSNLSDKNFQWRFNINLRNAIVWIIFM